MKCFEGNSPCAKKFYAFLKQHLKAVSLFYIQFAKVKVVFLWIGKLNNNLFTLASLLFMGQFLNVSMAQQWDVIHKGSFNNVIISDHSLIGNPFADYWQIISESSTVQYQWNLHQTPALSACTSAW